MSGIDTNDSNSRESLLPALRRRWRIIVLCIVLGGAAALVLSVMQRSEYTASTSLLFQNPGFDQLLAGSTSSPPPTDTDPTRAAATNIDLVSLPTVTALTASALHLSPAAVRSEVSVSGVGQADVAQIQVTDPNPVRAAQIANTYAQQYVLFRQRADRAKISGALGLVQGELGALPPSQSAGALGQSLRSRADQLRILAALQTGNAEVVQAASVPTSPSSPDTKRNAVLGVLLGLLFGMGLAFVLERLDRRIRDLSELEDVCGAPVLGAVPASPLFALAGREPLPAVEAEAFALLRARLRYFNVDREVRSLLITSAMPEEGKSVVALNLAIAEAITGQGDVVLVEADLRRPALSRRLGIAQIPGLAEILSRNATIESALRQVAVPRNRNGAVEAASFAVITAGAVPPNPAELMESHAMVDVLSRLSKRFDLVIIDTAPTSVVSDAIPLMRIVNGVVIVSRLDRITRDAARHLRDQLAKLSAPILGVIANAQSSKTGGDHDRYRHYWSSLPRPSIRSAPAARMQWPSPTTAERGRNRLVYARGDRVRARTVDLPACSTGPSAEPPREQLGEAEATAEDSAISSSRDDVRPPRP